MVEHVMQTANASTAAELANAQPTTPARSSRDIVKLGLNHRLECITPYAEHWSVAIALTMNPTSLPRAALLTAHLVDEVAFHADKTDAPNHGMQWYVRRAALCALYGAAEIHLIGDSTAGKTQTKLFVSTSVDNFWCAQK